MRFENLYKLVVNEAIETEDAAELADDPVSADVSADTPFPSQPSLMEMNDDEKVDYLVKNSKVINRNPNKTEAEKIAQAKWIVQNGFFDQFAEAIVARQDALADIAGEGEALEELPTDLEADKPTGEDIADIKPALSAEEELRKREQEEEEEGLPD